MNTIPVRQNESRILTKGVRLKQLAPFAVRPIDLLDRAHENSNTPKPRRIDSHDIIIHD